MGGQNIYAIPEAHGAVTRQKTLTPSLRATPLLCAQRTGAGTG